MEMLPQDIETLSLFEAIIAFGHNEFFKNKVRLLESLSIILFLVQIIFEEECEK